MIAKLMELRYLAGRGREERDTVSDKEPFGERRKKIVGEMLVVVKCFCTTT